MSKHVQSEYEFDHKDDFLFLFSNKILDAITNDTHIRVYYRRVYFLFDTVRKLEMPKIIRSLVNLKRTATRFLTLNV